ncbi:UDP-N-acetylglucosamine:LPS N-acetylglucosamine transferase [Thioflavicoccus mobilis 8321]|uniref:UDP-N-acetylglucosamine:LPS N-acetylglucosamine transferase n=1 Tax=Thioflavicoccus mobilis 8321 TaxID=765912 RepID=L0H109_9GAMM|nr:UDP-N-acetylglucosamine--LPS N-acetylglucosamine transferase [Thioflavicoccus mobilis]AGA91747.1 UDP-N-acetylglucosamine:LPS N-acetylglucosamine transferase [Thioflavicoccus mobilis 8321]
MKIVLLSSSSGGHWKQLMLVSAAFEGCVRHYATTEGGYRAGVEVERFTCLPEGSRWDKFGLVKMAWAAFRLVQRVKPDVVVSTGAAPGLAVVFFGKLLGARTIWIDSIANVERVSMSGRLCRPFADVWLTQWPHLAEQGGLDYQGSVL